MKVIVSAGPTYEPLDRVRRLTNFSTGSLGMELANYLFQKGHDVTLFRSEIATVGQPIKGVIPIPFTTTQSLLDTFVRLKTDEPVAIFHAAAVSDFYFSRVCERGKCGELKPISSGKFTTHSRQSLWVELLPTPKILSNLRNLYPNAWIVGWKYEVDGDQISVMTKAEQQLKECRSDFCVMNGEAYGEGFGILYANGKRNLEIPNKQKLFEILNSLIHLRTNL